MKSLFLIFVTATIATGYPSWPLENRHGDNYNGYVRSPYSKRDPEVTEALQPEVKIWKTKFNPNLNAGQLHKRQWFVQNDLESRFPLPDRRRFPEVDWRGFNEDVFHESFGDFTPMKRRLYN